MSDMVLLLALLGRFAQLRRYWLRDLPEKAPNRARYPSSGNQLAANTLLSEI